MISDVLSDAIAEMDRYMGEPAFANVYVGPIRVKIGILREQMEAIRVELDTLAHHAWMRMRIGLGAQLGAHDRIIRIFSIHEPHGRRDSGKGEMRFVELFSYDPVKDPTARLRVEWDPGFGNAVLSDEDTHPEHVRDVDARHVEVLASMQLGTSCVRWLHDALGKLLPQMEARDSEESKP